MNIIAPMNLEGKVKEELIWRAIFLGLIEHLIT